MAAMVGRDDEEGVGGWGRPQPAAAAAACSSLVIRFKPSTSSAQPSHGHVKNQLSESIECLVSSSGPSPTMSLRSILENAHFLYFSSDSRKQL